MYSAKDLHELTVKIQTEQTELKKQRTIKALEGSISTKLRQAAFMGDFSVTLEISHLLDPNLIVETLQNNGYQVTRKLLRVIEIQW